MITESSQAEKSPTRVLGSCSSSHFTYGLRFGSLLHASQEGGRERVAEPHSSATKSLLTERPMPASSNTLISASGYSARTSARWKIVPQPPALEPASRIFLGCGKCSSARSSAAEKLRTPWCWRMSVASLGLVKSLSPPNTEPSQYGTYRMFQLPTGLSASL